MNSIHLRIYSHTKELNSTHTKKIMDHPVQLHTHKENSSDLVKKIGVLQYLPLGIIRPRMKAQDRVLKARMQI